jgi:biopolymer transport protein ExbD
VTASIPTAEHATLRPASRWIVPVPHAGVVPDRIAQEIIRAGGLTDKVRARGLREGWLGWSAVEVSPAAVRVDGVTVVELAAGTVPSEWVRGYLIHPLFAALNERANVAKAFGAALGLEPFEGRLLLIIDPTTPRETVEKVMYTAGQAQYAELGLLVAAGPSQPPIPAVADGAYQVMITVRGDGGWTVASLAGDSLAVESPSALPQRLDDLLGDRQDLGCGMVGGDGAVAWGHIVPAIEALARRGVTPVFTVGSATPGQAAPGPTSPPPAGAAAPQIRVGAELWVHEVQLPTIGPPSPDPQGECFRGAPSLWIGGLSGRSR